MAIQIDKVLNTGIEVKSAYCRIVTIEMQKDRLEFTVKKFKDTAKPSFETSKYLCAYDIDGKNPFIQAYEYLKTLDEFTGAIDC